MTVKYGLRARVFSDDYLDLAALEADDILLFRSATKEQTDKTLLSLRNTFPASHISLVVQEELAGHFPVDKEIIYPFPGSFKLNDKTKLFFEQLAKKKYDLIVLIYNNLAKRNYGAVEECLLGCRGGKSLGILPDGSAVGIKPEAVRIRKLAENLHKRIMDKINHA